MDFSNMKFCQQTDKRRPNIRFLSTSSMTTPNYPFVPLNGHKPGIESDIKPPPVFQAGEFFKSQSISSCHQIPVIIRGFVATESKLDSRRLQDVTCQKLAAFSHNILDSISRRNFPGLNIAASYILSEGIQPSSSVTSASRPNCVKPDSRATLISDHSAASFSLPSSYANIAQQRSRQSYAAVTKMVASRTADNRQQNQPQRRHKRNSHYFNRNNCESYRQYTNDQSNWRDRTLVPDVKPRYVVERHPNFDRTNQADVNRRVSKPSRSLEPSRSSTETYRSSKARRLSDTCRSSEPSPLLKLCRPVEACEPLKPSRSSIDLCRSTEACKNWRCRQHQSGVKVETMRCVQQNVVEMEAEREAEVAVKQELTADKQTTCIAVIVEPLRSAPLQCIELDFDSASDSENEEDEDEEEDEDDWLTEVNTRWAAENPGPVVERPAADCKVKFQLPPIVHQMVCWNYAHRAARCGPWEQLARDRERFRLRIVRSQPLLAAVFCEGNRQRAAAYRHIDG